MIGGDKGGEAGIWLSWRGRPAARGANVVVGLEPAGYGLNMSNDGSITADSERRRPSRVSSGVVYFAETPVAALGGASPGTKAKARAEAVGREPSGEERQAESRSRVRRHPYDARVVDAIAETLRTSAGLAPFRLPGAAVHQVLVAGADERPATMLTLWPSIRRVDAVNGVTTAVLSGVDVIDLIDGVEVVFRRGEQATLIVTIGGKIIVRA